MALRFGFIALLVVLYLVGWQLHAAQAPVWMLAALMAAVFVALVAAMYLQVLPALLALPILAIALASIAGMDWKEIFSTVVQDGSVRLAKWIIAAIMGAILAQVVAKTGIAQTAIKKTAELGGDQPIILTVLLTIVIALLFTTLGGLGAVIMVATIVLPILLSLGLRPLYVGCLFLLAMSLGGAFNLVNWQAYESTLGMTQSQIIAFALPFGGLMLVVTFVFLAIEGKRMGKARYKAEVTEAEPTHQFVPWYALLTPIVPLVPVLFFALLPKMWAKPAEVTVALPDNAAYRVEVMRGLSDAEVHLLGNGATVQLKGGTYTAFLVPGQTEPGFPPDQVVTFKSAPWTKFTITVTQAAPADSPTLAVASAPTTYEFPIVVALLLGIIYGAITTWRRGQSTVQLITKSSFEGVAAVGPALVLLVGIGMVLNATMAPQVSGIIAPFMEKIVPAGKSGVGPMAHYVLLFTLLAPLALYRGPLNLYGMGAGLMGVLNPATGALMPVGAIMGAFMSVGMIQGVSDPTNTHNVWIANYTNTDVQEILKRTLPYMWALAILGLVLSAVLYYGGVIGS